MKSHILSRNNYINEIYNISSNDNVNEGLFDFFKTILKVEWKGIKSKNSNILKRLEESDDNLRGFTLVKLKKSSDCTMIRQTLVDFANTLWEFKLKELEDGKKLQKLLMGIRDKESVSSSDTEKMKSLSSSSNFLKSFDIKNTTLLNKLQNYEKKINDICQGDPDLTRWSSLLKNEIRNIINDMIIDEYEKNAKDTEKEKIKEKEKIIQTQQEEEKKKIEKENNELQKKQDDMIKQIEKERGDVLSKTGVHVIKGQNGDKVFNTLTTAFTDIKKGLNIKEGAQYSFENIIEESDVNNDKKEEQKEQKRLKKIQDILGSDVYFGLKDLTKIKDINSKLIKKIIKEINVVFNVVSEITDNGKKLQDVPSDAVQSMYVGLSEVIEHAMTDGKLDNEITQLLARCAIDSDKTLGYGLPLVDEKKPKEGNLFVAITNKLINAKDEAGVFGNDKELLNKFKQNMSKMFNDISNQAKKLKDEREKQDEQEFKKVNQEENK